MFPTALAMMLSCALALRPMLRTSSSVRLISTATRAISTKTAGEAGTESFRIFFSEGETSISPWHDIPLKAGDNLFHFVNEIPKYTKAKMEVATKEASNPIAQDIKKGKLRDYHGPIFWNYGCLPQTWEDPSVLNSAVNCKGDNDPVDVVHMATLTNRILPKSTTYWTPFLII